MAPPPRPLGPKEEDFPAVSGAEVLAQAIRDGLALLTSRADASGYAESYDEAAVPYRGLHFGHESTILPAAPFPR